MTASTSYSEASLAAFMVVELGLGSFGDGIVGVLGWVPGTPRVAYAVLETARMLRVTDITTVTDTAAVEVLGRLAIWRAARSALASRYAASTDGQSTHPEQMWEHAKEMVLACEREAAALGVLKSGLVRSYPISSNQNPYAPAVAAVAEF